MTDLDEKDRKEIAKRTITSPYAISVGITWIDLRNVFGPVDKHGQFWLGVCHTTDKIYMWTPIDFMSPLTVTTLKVDLVNKHCSKGKECVFFKCPLNRFDKAVFLDQFKDLGAETLGLPLDFGKKELWFNEMDSKWNNFWAKLLHMFKMKPAGGRLQFNEDNFFSVTRDVQLGRAIDKELKHLREKTENKIITPAEFEEEKNNG